MPVDPKIQEVLDLLASFNAPPMSQNDAVTARQNFRAMVVGSRDPNAEVPVASTEDIKFDGPAGPLAARIYRPERTGPLPTVVFFHGGGFVLGDIETHDNQCRWICRETEAVVLSVDYRVAPEAPWPAAVDDCFAATKWAFEHVEELGGDGARIAVAGDSAGGNLSAVVAQLCRDDGIALAGQLLIYPATDQRPLWEEYPSVMENAEGYLLTLDDMIWFSNHYFGESDPSDPRLSPQLGRLEGLAPAVVVTAEFDPLRDSGQAYARALREAGVPVTVHNFEGMIHGFFDLAAISPGAARAVQQTCADFKAVLW
jgi:acetyl esterase